MAMLCYLPQFCLGPFCFSQSSCMSLDTALQPGRYVLLLEPAAACRADAHGPQFQPCLQIGADVHGILLWPLGGLAFVGHSGTPARDIFVAVSGPLTHIPMFLVWFSALAIASHVIYHGAWAVSLDIPDPR